MKRKENEIYQVGSLANQIISTRDNPQARRVYLCKGISPCLNTMEGGGREPYIIIQKVGIKDD